jgi:nucleoid-associated protein YgaU
MSSTAPVIHLEEFMSRRSARDRSPTDLGTPSSRVGMEESPSMGVPPAPPTQAPPTQAPPTQAPSTPAPSTPARRRPADPGRRAQPERRRPRPAGVRACGPSARPRPRAAGSLALTRRGWVTMAVVAALLVSLGGIGVSALARQVAHGPGADGPRTAIRTTTVLVQPGQTLWEIAGEVAPAGTDVRVTVDRIAELNGLQRAGDLEVGQRLVVPAAVRR